MHHYFENDISALKAQYAKAETNVNKIIEVLEGHQVTLMKDVAMLDQMLIWFPLFIHYK